MLLTRAKAEKALLDASVKHTDWIEAVGFRSRVFMVGPDYDCSNLPDTFSILWRDAKECVILEQIDTLKGLF